MKRTLCSLKNDYAGEDAVGRSFFLYYPASPRFLTNNNFVLPFLSLDHGQWVPNGEAFRITDLRRLESETLPSYFRHSRFQSLVRQLNFYNFRKINRERTFWVYYHPLFHRDFPEKLTQLRRRTCPGFDGRRNKLPPTPLPPPKYSYDDASSKNNKAAKVSPATSAKVSRSPSPSTSPVNDPTVGKGSVRQSTRLGKSGSAFKSVVSMTGDDEVSPITSKKQKVDNRPSLTATTVTPAAEASTFHRTISTETIVSEEYVANKLHSHLTQTTSLLDVASAKSNSDSDEDEFHYYTSSNRKKISKEELEELQEHRYEVSEVSRHLVGICSDYAQSLKPRGRRGGRVTPGSSTNAVLQFGFDKPDNAYSGKKCDLFTYDYEEGEYIVEEDHRQALFSTKKEEEEVYMPTPDSPIKVQEVRPMSPSLCPLLNGRIAQACLDLDGVNSMPNSTMLQRTVASAILSFCLATHPQDPDADIKLRVHLQRGPMLAKEFDMYLMASLPSVDIGPRDRVNVWKSFSRNKLEHVIKALHDRSAPSSDERVAIKKVAECWFPGITV